MFETIVAGSLFVITHLGLSSTPARPVLVARIGVNGYRVAYSLLAFVTLGYLITVYNDALRLEYYWTIDPRLYWVPKILMAFALVFAMGAFMVRNPTSIGFEAAMTQPVKGMNRITRHPFQWGVVMWAASHIVANGDKVSVAFFSTFLLLSLAGTFLMDRKLAAAGGGWERFAMQTSNIPFRAILQGRNTIAWGELLAPIVVGVIAYVALFWGHEWLSGAAIFW
ncbi:MAG: NnrU family protein [Pseudomonadales bacterium]|jgi:uncharacterized membrane protein|nr:NnrU family protein [Pseudomonadales bacterium]MDP6470328.1 NnrU family protein [Pseudomonadales bacterium]MDP6827234.1 NnrU family protein [Pseudomonadales bacterium]MDP6972463.1 NnrU family protein [Pseudomonadales bacterium]|tara:strand:+ start:196 stop:867 length:672 start_codon:yes stop_codon:yes gene_type:complete